MALKGVRSAQLLMFLSEGGLLQAAGEVLHNLTVGSKPPSFMSVGYRKLAERSHRCSGQGAEWEDGAQLVLNCHVCSGTKGGCVAPVHLSSAVQ